MNVGGVQRAIRLVLPISCEACRFAGLKNIPTACIACQVNHSTTMLIFLEPLSELEKSKFWCEPAPIP